MAGNKFEDGLVAELSKEDKEDVQWKVDKVTLRGRDWDRNWILYSDSVDGEYTFVDKAPLEMRYGCWGQAAYWGNEKVCLAYGKVKREHETKWKNNFPKIKFEGWSTKFGGRGVISHSSIPLTQLDRCRISASERLAGTDFNLKVVITCADGSLVKTLSNSDFEKIALDKR